jgi:hypothetical protein
MQKNTGCSKAIGESAAITRVPDALIIACVVSVFKPALNRSGNPGVRFLEFEDESVLRVCVYDLQFKVCPKNLWWYTGTTSLFMRMLVLKESASMPIWFVSSKL